MIAPRSIIVKIIINALSFSSWKKKVFSKIDSTNKAVIVINYRTATLWVRNLDE